jgi:predicted DNA-binding protein (UPF0251 family)
MYTIPFRPRGPCFAPWATLLYLESIMLTQEMLEEIRSLLFNENLSQREVAQRLRVSRGTVQAVARNKCRLYTPLKRSPSQDFQPPCGLPLRCPSCGAKVQMPCLACYLAKRNKEENG